MNITNVTKVYQIGTHELASALLAIVTKRALICTEGGKVMAPLDPPQQGCNQMHIGNWKIENGKVIAYLVEQVESEVEPMTA